MNSRNRIILYSLLFGVLMYILDSVIDYLLFADDLTFLEAFITRVPLFEVYNRLIMVLGVIIFAFLVSSRISDLSIENEFLKMQASSSSAVKKEAELVNNLSYQIRTPLNAIVGFSELLKDPNLSAQSKQTYINHINSSGNYLLQLINNLVDISRIEEDSMILDLSECNLNRFMDEVKTYFEERKRELLKDKVEFRIEKDYDGDDFLISTDVERLKQVIINLLENAFRHTEEGFVEMGYKIKDDDLLEFYVKDSGRGFSEERLETIFGRYKTLTDRQNHPFDGTALRIGISKSLVKLLGGNISAHSKLGHGSTFNFTIPYMAVETEEFLEDHTEIKFIEKDKDGHNWSEKLILIAEDVESNFIYLRELLRPTKANLIWAENGRIALDKVKENPKIDLVLLDILMPEMDGYEAASKIKKFRPDLPIIAQTAYSFDFGKDKEEMANFNDYLIKPIWGPQLLSTVAKNL